MAARSGKMVDVSESSSSSDDEEKRRCREAVWTDENKDEDSRGKQSKRVVVADHEHDGNELQVTQGFRTHVATKLGHLLDSCITEMQTEASSCGASVKYDDEGFRLFSTSVPGQTAEDTPTPAKRQPVPSSSDSDSEMETRLREAAVSVKDLLPSSAQSSTRSPPTPEPPCPEKIKKKKKVSEGEESQEKVKKRRKQDQEEAVHADSADSLLNAQSNSVHGNTEQEHTHIKVKRKKKKKERGKIF